ncbi:hypothetical protein AB0G67_46555 [Streptomyces sp. NPDC021056]|uniref:hypothetical protein n=1 Tax=Streptomyces sp. NPDC021056 TaxID=3155012 RepID=UPI0033C89BB2
MLSASDVAEGAEPADTVSTALPETPPVERAVFVLREASAFAHAELGEFLGRPEATVQQIVHWVRKYVDGRRSRYGADIVRHHEVTARFRAACVAPGSAQGFQPPADQP